MNIFRIALILIIAAILWSGLKLLLRVYKLISTVRTATNRPRDLDHKTMVKCSTCDLYVLDRDAVVYQGKSYCCAEHVSRA